MNIKQFLILLNERIKKRTFYYVVIVVFIQDNYKREAHYSSQRGMTFI